MPTHPLTSHEGFDHDSIDSLGFDWERIANPGIAPCFPLKIYLPRETEHIVAAMQEAKMLGQKLWIRSKGHSSNDLVLAQDGAVLCTEKLNRIITIDAANETVLVQSGVVLAELDAALAVHGYGLPVIGDHNHITAGGFASVGGISPSSHRHGMFVDNVLEMVCVDADGLVKTCSRTVLAEEFHRVLAGTGRRGVIATLLLRIIAIDKQKTLLRNRRLLTTSLDHYIKETRKLIAHPGSVLFERGVWIDLPLGNFNVTVGQFSSYDAAPATAMNQWWRNLTYGYLHFLGRIAGRLPKVLDVVVKYLGIVGVVLSPRYATVSDVESFTDKVLDSSVGDPTRMLVVLAPVEKYDVLFRQIHALCSDFRAKHGCFKFISFYVKAIESAYLKPVNVTGKFSELMLYLGMVPEKMTDALLADLVSKIDDLCIAHAAVRYMHTKTVKDLRRQKVDPNAYHP